MSNYYEEKLNADLLFRVYDTQLSRIRQYLSAEIEFVRSRLSGSESVLELGAGYGRIVRALAPYCRKILGIDISPGSVSLGKEYLREVPNAELLVMDAHKLDLRETFDVILCLQNGLSAIKADQDLMDQLLLHLPPGGAAYFSTYTEAFWEHRLAWFREQAEKGLLSSIDEEKTRDGMIVCTDGFTARTYSSDDLEHIGRQTGFSYEIQEVDGSSLFLVISRPC